MRSTLFERLARGGGNQPLERLLGRGNRAHEVRSVDELARPGAAGGRPKELPTRELDRK